VGGHTETFINHLLVCDTINPSLSANLGLNHWFNSTQHMANELRHLVRIGTADLKGTQTLLYGLTRIKGMGIMLAHAMCTTLKMSPTMKVGELKDADVAKILEFVANPLQAGVPRWMVNRRKDPETGKDTHYSSTKLKLRVQDDKKVLKKIKCYRGIRHMFGLPCRGQRTKSNFRPNKGKISLANKKKNKNTGRV
jgi:small subunit ribosomal protein S13